MAETTTISSPPKPNPLVLRVQASCGDCVFFSRLRLPNAVASCATMGCPSSRVPCRKFKPNVFIQEIGDSLGDKNIRAALNSIPDAALGALSLAITEMRSIRALGYSLGQVVYFNAVSPSGTRDFLANYYRARVLSVDADGNVILGGLGVSASISADHVITAEAWKTKKAALLRAEKICDPKSPFTWERKDLKALSNAKYKPKWLDSEIAKYRASYLDAKSTRQTHDYDAAPVKRGRGRPRKDGSPPKTEQKVRARDLSAAT